MKPAPLTDEQIDEAYDAARPAFKSHMSKVRGQQVMPSDGFDWHFARSIEAVRDQQWQEMLAKQEPVAWPDLLKEAEEIVRGKFLWKRFIDGTPLANDVPCWMADFAQTHRPTPPDHTAVMRQALEALDCLEAPPTGAINHYELERRKNALRAALAQPDVPEGYKLLRDSTHDERSWPEDFNHENGCYHNTCVHCLRGFLGYKRRGICKVCAAPKGGA